MCPVGKRPVLSSCESVYPKGSVCSLTRALSTASPFPPLTLFLHRSISVPLVHLFLFSLFFHLSTVPLLFYTFAVFPSDLPSSHGKTALKTIVDRMLDDTTIIQRLSSFTSSSSSSSFTDHLHLFPGLFLCRGIIEQAESSSSSSWFWSLSLLRAPRS